MIRELDTRHGKMFIPSTDDGQYWWFVMTGSAPEDEYIELCCNLLAERPKGCAVDVGANFGAWTLPLTKVAHTVVAIEPQAGVHQLLRQTVEANGLRNVELLRMAAGDRTGVEQIPCLDVERDANFGGVELNRQFEHQPNVPMEAVHIDKLDHLLMGYQVSFIKMDVEGYEQKVLDGARKVMERCRPIVFLEADHPRSSAEGLRQTLQDRGYSVLQQGGNWLGMPL